MLGRLGRWDDCCPHCEQKIKELYEYFVSKEYKNDFTIGCPRCEQPIQVYVHAVPKFELYKAKTENRPG